MPLDLPVTDITPAERYTGSDILGQVGTSVGFGVTGNGLTGGTTFDGKKRAGENMIDVWLRTRGRERAVFLKDFDNPDDPGDSRYGSSTPLNLEYLIFSGDSGGGEFIDHDGDSGTAPLLAGVHSFGASFDGLTNSDYGDVSGHGFVPLVNDWIDEQLGLLVGGDDGGGGGGGPPSGRGGGRPTLHVALAAGGSVTVVPEPSSFALAALGLLGMAAFWRRRHSIG